MRSEKERLPKSLGVCRLGVGLPTLGQYARSQDLGAGSPSGLAAESRPGLWGAEPRPPRLGAPLPIGCWSWPLPGPPAREGVSKAGAAEAPGAPAECGGPAAAPVSLQLPSFGPMPAELRQVGKNLVPRGSGAVS